MDSHDDDKHRSRRKTKTSEGTMANVLFPRLYVPTISVRSVKGSIISNRGPRSPLPSPNSFLSRGDSFRSRTPTSFIQLSPTPDLLLGEHLDPIRTDFEIEKISMWRRIHDRLGRTAMAILLVTFLTIVGCLGFISFLWFADARNSTWYKLARKDFMTKAVTLTALLLRGSVSLQAGVCFSMIAALALEKYVMSLQAAVPVSMMRSTDVGVFSACYKLATPLAKNFKQNASLVIITILLVYTMVMSQFTSTALLFDIGSTILEGPETFSNITYDFSRTKDSAYDYDLSQPLWTRPRPTSFPVFAEASTSFGEPAASDTGPSLRAFLPFDNSTTRTGLSMYAGPAVVMDSRVSCQKPNISDIRWDPLSLSLSGIVLPTKQMDKLPSNWTDSQPKFSCALNFIVNGYSICDLPSSGPTGGERPSPGGLYSQMRYDPQNTSTEPADRNTTVNVGTTFLIFSSNNTDIANANDWAVLNSFMGEKGDTVSVQATVCYTAMDIRRQFIQAFGALHRTEGSAKWDPKTKTFTWDALYHQIYSNKSGNPPYDRGILSLSDSTENDKNFVIDPAVNSMVMNDTGEYLDNFNWYTLDVPPGPKLKTIPYLAAGLRITNPDDLDSQRTPLGGFTAVLNNGTNAPNAAARLSISPESWVSDLWNYFMAMDRKSPPTALALQSLLTTLAISGYYDQLPRYDAKSNYEITTFDSATTPAFWRMHTHHLPVGYMWVCFIVVLHGVLVVIVTVRFLTETKHSRIDDHWQSVAHIAASEDARMLMSKAACPQTDRKGFRGSLKRLGGEANMVGVRVGGNGDVGRSVRLRGQGSWNKL